MIKDPPLLTIRRAFPRPSAAVMRAFTGVPTGYVIDAMGGRDKLIKNSTALMRMLSTAC